MAKLVTGDLVGASGKIGDKVYYQSNGKTVVRSISAANYNSKTVQQILQRVIIKTVASNYAAMKDIVNHSFQGVKKGADSMARFNSLNAQYLRDRAGEIVNQGMSLDSFIQFSKLGQKKFIPAALYLSEGTLTQIHPSITPFTTQGSAVATLDVPENTYASLANQYNLRRGDQVTLITVEKDAYGEYLFKYSRIILDPRTEDGDAAPMTSALISDSNAVAFPNRRNEGSYFYLGYANSKLQFKHINGDVAAVAVIASRKSGSDWFRSTAKFILSEEVIGSDKVSLLGAIVAAQGTASTEIYIGEDELYLNNAGTGGSQGEETSSSSETPVSTEMVLDQIVKINGVNQNVSSGSISMQQTSTEAADDGLDISITGQNITEDKLAEIGVTVMNQPNVEIQKDRSADNTTVEILIKGYTLPATVKFLNEGASWFNVTISENNGGGGDVNDGYDVG